MKKIIRQVTGTQVGITFTKEEQDIHGIEVGGVADISDAIFLTKQQLADKNIPEIGKKMKDEN